MIAAGAGAAHSSSLLSSIVHANAKFMAGGLVVGAVSAAVLPDSPAADGVGLAGPLTATAGATMWAARHGRPLGAAGAMAFWLGASAATGTALVQVLGFERGAEK